MGCTGSNGSEKTDRIIIQMKRTKISLSHQQSRVTKEGAQLQRTLIAQFRKPKAQRNGLIEKSMIDQIVYAYNKTTLFSVAIHQLTRVLDYAHFLQVKEKRDQIMYNLRRALFMASILGDQNLLKLSQMVKLCYQEIEDLKEQEILEDTIRHYKSTNVPTEKMKTEYIMQLCNQQGLTLQQINQGKHNFRYGV